MNLKRGFEKNRSVFRFPPPNFFFFGCYLFFEEEKKTTFWKLVNSDCRTIKIISRIRIQMQTIRIRNPVFNRGNQRYWVWTISKPSVMRVRCPHNRVLIHTHNNHYRTGQKLKAGHFFSLHYQLRTKGKREKRANIANRHTFFFGRRVINTV